jgi:uncharacterized membrane protein
MIASCELYPRKPALENMKTGRITMNRFILRSVLMQAMIASAYVVLVYIFQFASFGLIQFRVAEVLMIMVLFDRKSIIGLTLGCFVSNLLLGAIFIDVIIGPIATLLAGIAMVMTKNHPKIAMIWPAVFNGVIIGFILTYGYLLAPLFISIPSVFIGEALVLYLIGLPVYMVLSKHQAFKELFRPQ